MIKVEENGKEEFTYKCEYCQDFNSISMFTLLVKILIVFLFNYGCTVRRNNYSWCSELAN